MKTSPPQPPVNLSVFIGDDWLAYMGYPAYYPMSEMIAPSLLFSRTHEAVHVSNPSGFTVSSQCLMHAGNHWSQCQGTALALVYFDPLSPIGQSIQTHAKKSKHGFSPWSLPAKENDMLLNNILTQPVSQASAMQLVNYCKNTLIRPTSQHLSNRLIQTADLIARNPSGHLNVSSISAAVFWSADHLRKHFKQAVGMNLSQYQMWQRLRQMVHFACISQNDSGQAIGESMVHAAGFYDVSHGNRSMQRFFGMTVAAIAAPLGGFTDCRTRTLTHQAHLSINEHKPS